MYYFMMKTALKTDSKSKSFTYSRSFNRLSEKEINSVDFKFYQKLFVVLISLSTILIFPQSPILLEDICQSYNSKELCKVW